MLETMRKSHRYLSVFGSVCTDALRHFTKALTPNNVWSQVPESGVYPSNMLLTPYKRIDPKTPVSSARIQCFTKQTFSALQTHWVKKNPLSSARIQCFAKQHLTLYKRTDPKNIRSQAPESRVLLNNI